MSTREKLCSFRSSSWNPTWSQSRREGDQKRAGSMQSACRCCSWHSAGMQPTQSSHHAAAIPANLPEGTPVWRPEHWDTFVLCDFMFRKRLDRAGKDAISSSCLKKTGARTELQASGLLIFLNLPTPALQLGRQHAA